MAPRKRKLPVPKDVFEKNEDRVNEKHHVAKVLENAQINEAFHNKYVKDLQEQYAKIGHEEFVALFICCLKQLIPKEDNNEYSIIGLKFMAKFATSFKSDDMHPLLEALFNWVLKTVSLAPNVRARLCLFVNLLLNSLGSNASLDDDLFEEILNYMFDRLKDLYSPVRVQAIKALQRLQVPDDPDDPIVKIYTFHLASDPSGVVRQAVLTCLGRNLHTIPVILERLWDIDEKVRRHVYVHMSNYPVKTYKVAHRLTFLEQGLNDRSDSVRKIVTGVLIPQWLESYNKNYLAFLNGLKLDSNQVQIDRFRSTARLALNEIFKTQNAEDLINALSLDTDEGCAYPKCIPFDKLTIESSLFWWALIVYFQQDERRSEYLETIIPELSLFCSYVQKYNDNINNEENEQWDAFISQNILFNLIEILLTFDYGDEIGRQHLRTLTTNLLTTNPCNENSIKSLVKVCEKLIPNSDDRLQLYVDVIRGLVDQDSFESSVNFSDTNVVEALEKDPNLNIQVSSLKLKLYELKEEESKFVKTKDYGKVSQISEQITYCNEQLANLLRPLMTSGSNYVQQKRITTELQIKALQLAFYGVCSRNVTKLNPAMCQLYTDFIRLKIESSEMEVRNLALKCGATFSLLYEQLAKDVFAALNKQFFEHHVTGIWTISVRAMFQLIVRYGFSYFDDDSQGNENVEEKPKEKSKKSRTLYNAMEYLDDPEDDSSVEKGENVTIKGLIYLFGHFMDTCDDIHLMSALVDGFCLLILHGLYIDEKMVSRLILLYFNPSTEPEVNQILSIFFETLIHQKKQECLEGALIQTLTKIIEASSESPLHEVKIETVLKFIINSTLPVYCKSDLNIHNSMATSLFKWMNTNATNRELLRIVSKEILTLEISDEKEIRESLQMLADQLLEMPMDLRTEKNLKSFKEIMKGKHAKEIEFSSVAPVNRIDGELEEDANDELRNLSDNESSNINDEDKSIDGVNDAAEDDVVNGSANGVNNEAEAGANDGAVVVEKDGTHDGPEKAACEEQDNENAIGSDVRTNDLTENPSTPVTAGTVPTEYEKENASEKTDERKKNSRKRLSSEETDKIPSPSKIRNNSTIETSDSDSPPQQIQVQANVHNVIAPQEHATAVPNREPVQRHLMMQQTQNSPDIQVITTPRTNSAMKRRGRPKKVVAQTSASNPSNYSGKRKSISLKSKQAKGDLEDQSPKKKKSKSGHFSENNEQEKNKTTNDQNKSIEDVSGTQRSSQRNRTPSSKMKSNDEDTIKKSVRKDENPKNKQPIKKQVISHIPTKLSRRNAERIGTSANQKKNEITTRGKRSLSEGVVMGSRSSVSSKAKTPAKEKPTKSTPIQTPKVASTRARTSASNIERSRRDRLISSEPPARKQNSKTRTLKGTLLEMAVSLTNINDSKHRTRRAITKEFIENNVMTRKRASIDGVKLLEKIDPLTTSKRSNSIVVGSSNQKAKKTTKISKRVIPQKSMIPVPRNRVKA